MLRGIVEGFYGTPWDLVDRLSVMSFMSKVGMNIYIYGPKQDPFHRERWRSPYPQSMINEFSILIDGARRFGIELVYAISPGLDIDYSSKHDLNVLIRKLESMMELGIESLAIFLDDIPPVLRGKGFRTLAEAQATLVNKVYEELKPKLMIFCPTFYWGFKEDYLGDLCTCLDTSVEVMWTGPHVVSPTITLDDVRKVASIMGKKPFIWDNYPVNDFFITRGVIRLHMGPLTDREPGIREAISGYVANPMNQAEASKFPIYTIAEFLRKGREYDPVRAIEESVRLVINDEVQEEFRDFIALNSASPMRPDGDRVVSEDKDISLSIESLRIKLSNKKLLHEIHPVLEKLEILSRVLKERKEELYKKLMSMRVQTCGEYEPPLNDEEMKGLFGKVVKVRPWWKR